MRRFYAICFKALNINICVSLVINQCAREYFTRFVYEDSFNLV